MKYVIKEDEIPGGRGDRMRPDEVEDERELKIGMEVEFEHTNDKSKALEISLDILAKIPDIIQN